MRLVFDGESVAAFVGMMNGKMFAQPYSAFGVEENGEIVGGFVFNQHNGTNVEMSLAGGGVARRSVWQAVIQYVFGQLGCVRLQIHTRRSNKMVKKAARRLGFSFEGVARRFYGDEDGLCYSLTVDDLPAFVERWKLKV